MFRRAHICQLIICYATGFMQIPKERMSTKNNKKKHIFSSVKYSYYTGFLIGLENKETVVIKRIFFNLIYNAQITLVS